MGYQFTSLIATHDPPPPSVQRPPGVLLDPATLGSPPPSPQTPKYEALT
jgi:hypothetical protein